MKTWSRSMLGDVQRQPGAALRLFAHLVQDGVLVADEVLVTAAGVAGLQGSERALADESLAGTDVQEEHQVRLRQMREDLLAQAGGHLGVDRVPGEDLVVRVVEDHVGARGEGRAG